MHKKYLYSASVLMAILVFNCRLETAVAQSTMFTYQGHVTDNGTNFNGTGQFKFALVTSTNNATQATATAVLTSGAVTGINVVNGGSGYVSAPGVTISGGGGVSATAHATLNAGVVTGIIVDSGGSGYTSIPAVTVAAPPANISYTTYWSNDGTSASGSQPTASVNANVNNGLFTVVIGDTTMANMSAIDASVFAQPNLQLRIWFSDSVNAFAALDPAQKLTAAPYAANALAVSSSSGISIQQNAVGPNVIEGSANNFVSGSVGATIGGGGGTNYSTYFGYQSYTNIVLSDFGTVSGGAQNTAGSGYYGFGATVGGGFGNMATLSGGTVSGGSDNTNTGTASTIGGGSQNTVSGNYATLGGGDRNHLTGIYGTIGGGQLNIASGQYSTVSGGQQNTAGGGHAVVGGGNVNNALGDTATVAGGGYNNAIGNRSTVSGGVGNSATNTYATIPGGFTNVAGGQFSFAAGQQAQALHDGSFVWADSQNAVFSSTGINQFLIRANGGVGINNNNPGATLDVNGTVSVAANRTGDFGNSVMQVQNSGTSPALRVVSGPTSSLSGALSVSVLNSTDPIAEFGNPSAFVTFINNNGSITAPAFNGSVQISTNGSLRLDDRPIYLRTGTDVNHGLAYNGQTVTNFGTGQYQVDGPVLWGFTGGILGSKSGGDHAALQWNSTSVTVNGTFNNNSDRNAKQDFASVAPADILDKVAKLPLSEWSYKVDAGTRHIGPMAQDFYSSFSVGTDERHIAPIDEGGVALAAIQGLNAKVDDGSQRAEVRMQQLEKENAELRARLEKLERLLTSPAAAQRE